MEITLENVSTKIFTGQWKHVHYEIPFEKHFNSFQKYPLEKYFGSAWLEHYGICRCEFITHTQQPHLIFLIFWEKRERNLTFET